MKTLGILIAALFALVIGVAMGPAIRHELSWRRTRRETLPSRFRDVEGS